MWNKFHKSDHWISSLKIMQKYTFNRSILIAEDKYSILAKNGAFAKTWKFQSSIKGTLHQFCQ